MGDKVGKLNDVITELETQTEDIKNFTQVLKEIDKISKNAASLDEKVSKNVQSYVAVSETMQKSADLLDNRLDALESLIRTDIQEIYKDNKNFQKELDDSIRIRLEKVKLDIENKIDVMNTKAARIDHEITKIDKKLTSLLEAYEEDKKKGFFARLFNN